MRLSRCLPLALVCTFAACAGNVDDPSETEGVDTALDETGGAGPAEEASFTAFESGQVRPLALSADRKILFALNTPDNRVEMFRTGGSRLRPIGSVRVGLEPVALAATCDGELWVVNHLSDSVSIVDVSNPEHAYVKRTLLVGDEPRDIVFADRRAFITTAHRGQNTGRDPQLTTPGVGRADVWVFDQASQGSTLAGTPVTVINLFSDTPRALTVSADGHTVFAAAFHSGNRTTTIHERIVSNNGGAPEPTVSLDGVPAPATGLVVKYRVGTPDGQYHWLDETNRIWDSQVMFGLPDKDVFAIDASLATPALKPDATAQVGTVLFNMAVNPVSGKVYVSNLESHNEVRFEGHNTAGGTGSVRGHIADSRISVIESGVATPRHLNKHINYAVDGTPAEAAKSLAFPTGMAVSEDGKNLFVAAFGSSKLGVFKTRELENDSFVPSTSAQVALTGGGPTGLVLHEELAYVLTRFDNGISIVNTRSKQEVSHLTMYNPEPTSITAGRRFLYDAAISSSHGDSACASCHIFGDLDSLAWDLGDPDGQVLNNPGPFTIPLLPFFPSEDMHPMKGPMSTQSLRGMANHGPMHWRGDRTGGNAVSESAQPDTGTFDEQAAFKAFNVAFAGLLGRASVLSDADMQAFTDFALQLSYPPNPIRNLDNSLSADQEAGRAFFFNHVEDTELPSDTFRNCNGCHVTNLAGNAEFGVAKPGFFGSDGRYSFESESQFMKVPHLRNLYQKVGMFGMANTFALPLDSFPPALQFLPPPFNDVSFQGDQVRGFGFTHDGSVDTVFRFVGANLFAQRPADDQFPNPFGIPTSAEGIELRRQLESFLLAFDSNLAPIVGQQVTLTATNSAAVASRIDLIEQRAAAGECDLVVSTLVHGRPAGFLYLPESNAFAPDSTRAANVSEAQLRGFARRAPITFTAVPKGSGERIALDRDSNGVLDGDTHAGS